MLAIVIPFYKKKYFKETLDSIASQTCKDFVLYIGDDASLESPQDIIEEYKNEITIVYHRFEENLGGKNLVAQWERCINLTNNEDWIWLFSDDDTMEETCVQDFYEVVKKTNEVQIIRFPKKIKNIMTGQIWNYKYDNAITLFSEFIFDALDMTDYHVTMPEFIWQRQLYEKYGIVNFPLAWGSDKATYLNYVYHVGFIYNIDSEINFRLSPEHISSKQDDTLDAIKLKADIMYEKYIAKSFLEYSKKYPYINWSNIIDKRVSRYKTLSFINRIYLVKILKPLIKDFRDVKNAIKILIRK